MATQEPGCCDGPNELLRKILLGINVVAGGNDSLGGTAELANVPTSTTSAILRVANTERKSLWIFNDASSVLFVKFGATASSTSFTFAIQPNGYERIDTYNGRVDGILVSGTGNARVTEVSP